MIKYLSPGVTVVEHDVSIHYGDGPAVFADSQRPLSFWVIRYRMTAEQQLELDEWLTLMDLWHCVRVEGLTSTPIIQLPTEQLAMLFKLKFV